MTTRTELDSDSLFHVLSFCGAVELCASTSVCREWLASVATPSIAQSQLWAALAATIWAREHRLHAFAPDEPAAEASADAEEDGAEVDASEVIAALHPAHPIEPVIAPFLHPSIGFRELLFHSTRWPACIDSSSAAVFSTRENDLHQCVKLPPLTANQKLALLEASSKRSAARRAERAAGAPAAAAAAASDDELPSRSASPASLSARAARATLDAAMERFEPSWSAGEDDDDDDSDDDGSQAPSDCGSDWSAGELDEPVQDSSAQSPYLRAADTASQFQELCRQEFRGAIARSWHWIQNRRAKKLGKTKKIQPTPTTAATPATPAAAALAAALASEEAESGEFDAPRTARPSFRTAQRDIAAIRAALTGSGVDAQSQAALLQTMGLRGDGDEEAEDEDGDYTDDGGEGDADFDDDDGEDEIDFDDEEQSQVDSEDVEHLMADHPAHELDHEEDEASELSRLFELCMDDVKAFETAQNKAELLESMLTQPESLAHIDALRQAVLERRKRIRRSDAWMYERVLRTARIDLGCLALGGAGHTESVEAKSSEDAHLTCFKYSGNVSGADRSVRADCPFPTCLPRHRTPVTSMLWVRRELLEKYQREDEAERIALQQSALGFASARSVLSAASGSSSPAAAASHKRKQSSAAAPSPLPLATPQPDENKRQRTDPEEEPESDSAHSLHVAPSRFVPVVRLTMLLYFEITITAESEAARTKRLAAEERSQTFFSEESNCVAIGFGTERFKLVGKQPGWDSGSFGFHSDDGGIFHGSGSSSSRYSSRGFGPGDIVGAGFDAAHGHIFFTRNGMHLGIAFDGQISGSFYPIVGLDTIWTVAINFGDSPFAFDVLGYERKMLNRLPFPRPIAPPEPDAPVAAVAAAAPAASGPDAMQDVAESKESASEQSAAAAAFTPTHLLPASSRAPVVQLREDFLALHRSVKQAQSAKAHRLAARALGASTFSVQTTAEGIE